MNLKIQILNLKKIFLGLLILFIISGIFPHSAVAVDFIPTIEKFIPENIEEGHTEDLPVKMIGKNFTASSKVYKRGIEVPDVTYVNPTQLEFVIPQSDLQKIDQIEFKVNNGAGDPSALKYFMVEKKTVGLFGSAAKVIAAGMCLFPPFTPFCASAAAGYGLYSLTGPLAIIYKAPADFLRGSSYFIAEISQSILSFILNQITNNEEWSITRACTSTKISPPPTDIEGPCGEYKTTFAGAAFLMVWGEIRNWANMLIVLGLIAIALATILRWPSDWEAKKLLPVLLGVALLINFSVVFVGIIIDFSNLLMKGLLFGTSADSISNLTLSINEAWNAFSPTSPDLIKYWAVSIILSILYLLVATVLLWFSFIFIERYVMLAILFVFSPLVFVAYIFPKTKSYFTSWKERLIKWCFIGLGAALMMRLAISILTVFAKSSSSGGITDSYDLDGLPKLIFRLLIVILFMLTSLKLLAKADGLAKVVMAAVTATVAAFVTGGTSILGNATGGALKIAGNTGPGTSMKEAFSSLKNNSSDFWARQRERIGLEKEGTVKLKQKERQDKKMEEYRKIADTEKDNNIITQRAMDTNRTAAERAVYTEKLIKSGKTGLIPKNKIKEVIKNAQAHYIDTSAFEKTNLDLVDIDRVKMDEAKRALISAPGSIFTQDHMKEGNAGYAALENAAINKRRREIIKTMSPEDIRKLKNITRDVLEEVNQKKLSKAMEELNGDREAEIRKIRQDIEAEYYTTSIASDLPKLQRLMDKIDTAIN